MGITKFILNRLRILNPFLTVWSSDCTQETEQIIPPLIHRAAPMILAWPGEMTQGVRAVYQKTTLSTSAANGALRPASPPSRPSRLGEHGSMPRPLGRGCQCWAEPVSSYTLESAWMQTSLGWRRGSAGAADRPSNTNAVPRISKLMPGSAQCWQRKANPNSQLFPEYSFQSELPSHPTALSNSSRQPPHGALQK